ncbi:gamma-glutamyltransferase [Phormidium tenue]|uniref:Glutathione hydrolase proenzyme n=1 Tax=Phormidium tenue NIES-30 TaxID=549789 RepID=A0A1U7JA79_9CYAN|nr:gamma-glutamyltransferase [Phormidium tenue]MBD2230638.1 gamma-glutamyltransferase [Phormidium tenue FACHB-1052]OKH50600.1 gamma-glutamyltransferase [Phormidium tenue NIES-30]
MSIPKVNRGAIAAGHALTAEAGAEMLRQGGNAFDAAIAAAFTACVVESSLTSLAGGGFLLAHTAAGENRLFDFFCQTPRSKAIGRSPDFYPIHANFGDTVQEFHIGLGSMAVPGAIAGLLHVHQRLGRLPLKQIVAPAQHWATQGTQVEPFRAGCFQILAPILTATAEARAIYAPGGTLLTAGDRFYLPDFAAFLDDLARQGADLFYRGDLAHAIAQDCQAHGGYLTLEDLQTYQVVEREPLAVPYGSATLLTNPPPSSGGTLIAFALHLLAQASPALTAHGSPRHVAMLREVMSLTNLARQKGYDDHLYRSEIAQEFLGVAHLAPYLEQFQAVLSRGGSKWGSTTHISVVDGEGNAASLTTSNGEGSAYVIPGTGIMMNNMLGEEDLNPQGFHQWPTNQRMSSMMAPTVVLKDGKPCLVLGSGGSNRIRTAILQVVSNVLDFDMDIEAAVSAPRLHWERGALHLEPGYEQAAIAAQGITGDDVCTWWQAPSMFFGGVHAVAVDPDGTLSGIGDGRRGGAWIVVDG